MATRTISNAGGNFNAVGTWVEGIVPVAGDSVVATATSGNLTVNVASGGTGLLSFDMTNYTGQLIMSNTLTVSGNVKLVAGMTITGSANLIVNATGTLTSGGQTWPGGITFSGTSTFTLADAWIVTGTVDSGTATVKTFNGFTMTLLSSWNYVSIWAGTTEFILAGTGTFSNTLGEVRLNTTINTSGTITMNTQLIYNTGTFKYLAGTVNATSCSLLASGAAGPTFNTNGMLWGTVTFGNPTTITLQSDFQCGALSMPTLAFTMSGAYNIYCTSLSTQFTFTATLTGNIICSGSWTISSAGTYTQTFNGAFTVSCVGLAAGSGSPTIRGSSSVTVAGGNVSGTTLTINGTGTYTFKGRINWSLTTFTITAGTVTGANAELVINSNVTFSNTVTWGNWRVTGSSTITLNALQTINGALELQANTTFAGSNSWTINTFYMSGYGISCTLVNGKTYTVTNNVIINGSYGSPSSLLSDSGVTKAIFKLNTGGSQNINFANVSLIDSSSGISMYTYKGTVTTCLNWSVATSRLGNGRQITPIDFQKIFPRRLGSLKAIANTSRPSITITPSKCI